MSTNGISREPEIQLHLKEPTNPIKTTKKKRRYAKLCTNFGDYSENTTLHGIKYLGEQERPLAEKVWWVIGFLICIGCLGYFIYIIVDKWQKSPVIVTTDDKTTPIYDIPFPAVTLCPETKMKSRLFNYTDTTNKLEKHSKLPEDERASNASVKYFEAMSHICEYEHFLTTDQSLWKGKQFMDKSYVHAMLEIAPDYKDLFIVCLWGNETDCKKILIPIVTEDGQCYTFNLVKEIFRNDVMQDDYFYFLSNNTMKHWNFDMGYTSGATEDAYPARAMAMGRRHGLTLMLKNYNDDINYLCREGDQGYKITLHNPTEYPQPYKNFIRVPHGQSAQFAIGPKIVKTSNSLNSYSPERRQCFFNHERHLKYFHTYNQDNCKLECVANLTYSACGCIKFSLPRGRGVPICGAEKIACYAPIWNEAENNILLKQFKEQYFGQNDSNKIHALDECNCLPECTSVHYAAEHEFTNFNFRKAIQEYDPEWLENEDKSNREYTITRIDLYFASTRFYGETRSELYGISDLVSNFGGLLGLFLGGSILSLVELLYFCTIRNLCNSKRSGGHEVPEDD